MQNRRAFLCVLSCFFLCGLSTTLNDTLIPFLKESFALSYTRVMEVQLSFFLAYFALCPLAGMLTSRWGYHTSLLSGLSLGGLGSLCLFSALSVQAFYGVLMGVFAMGAGVAVLQVAVIPLALQLGPAQTATSRLTFAQSMMGVGFVAAPLLGSRFLGEARMGAFPYLYLALFLLWVLVAVGKWGVKELPQPEEERSETGKIWHSSAIKWGFLAVFLYVGSEVAVGSLLVSTLCLDRVGWEMSLDQAARWAGVYWSGLVLGRLMGGGIFKVCSPVTVLVGSGLLATTCLVIASISSGGGAMACLLLVGACISIQYPAVITLTTEACPLAGAKVAGVLCMANVGGAVYPLAQGALADIWSLQRSFLLPALGYLGVVACALLLKSLKEEKRALSQEASPSLSH